MFVKDPASRRSATADEEGTTVLVIGGRPGVPFSISPWERSAEALRFWTTGEWDRAIHVLEGNTSRIRVTRTCSTTSRAPRARGEYFDAAVDHLAAGGGAGAAVLELAQTDSDLDSIRGDERFPHRLSLRVGQSGAGSPGSRASAPGPENRRRIVPGPGRRRLRACVGPAGAPDEELETGGESKRFVRQRAAERDDSGRGAAGEHVAVRDRSHRDIGYDGFAVARRSRSRSDSSRSTAPRRPGGASRAGGGGGEEAPETHPWASTADPVAERTGREAMKARTEAGSDGGFAAIRRRRYANQVQIAEAHLHRPSGRGRCRRPSFTGRADGSIPWGLQPRDPRKAVSELAAPLGVAEMGKQRPHAVVTEPERARDVRVPPRAWTAHHPSWGRLLTILTKCLRRPRTSQTHRPEDAHGNPNLQGGTVRRILISGLAAAVALATAGFALATLKSAGVSSATATFSAAKQRSETRTCTGDGDTYEITNGRYVGTIDFADPNSDLDGPVTIHARTVLNKTDGIGYVAGTFWVKDDDRRAHGSLWAVIDGNGNLDGAGRAVSTGGSHC